VLKDSKEGVISRRRKAIGGSISLRIVSSSPVELIHAVCSVFGDGEELRNKD